MLALPKKLTGEFQAMAMYLFNFILNNFNLYNCIPRYVNYLLFLYGEY